MSVTSRLPTRDGPGFTAHREALLDSKNSVAQIARVLAASASSVAD